MFFQYRHIGDIADRYRCRQTDSSIADTDTSIGIVANPAPHTELPTAGSGYRATSTQHTACRGVGWRRVDG